MARTDRAIRRTGRLLAPNEVLVASVVAREADGRRRHAVLVTDTRVVVVALRDGSTCEFPLETSTCGFEPVGGLLTLASDGEEIVLRDVDPIPGRSLVELLSARAARRQAQHAVRPARTRSLAG